MTRDDAPPEEPFTYPTGRHLLNLVITSLLHCAEPRCVAEVEKEALFAFHICRTPPTSRRQASFVFSASCVQGLVCQLPRDRRRPLTGIFRALQPGDGGRFAVVDSTSFSVAQFKTTR